MILPLIEIRMVGRIAMTFEEIEGGAKANLRWVSILFFGPVAGSSQGDQHAEGSFRSSGTASRSARKRKRFRYPAHTPDGTRAPDHAVERIDRNALLIVLGETPLHLLADYPSRYHHLSSP
jgi:hypothetical protein